MAAVLVLLTPIYWRPHLKMVISYGRAISALQISHKNLAAAQILTDYSHIKAIISQASAKNNRLFSACTAFVARFFELIAFNPIGPAIGIGQHPANAVIEL